MKTHNRLIEGEINSLIDMGKKDIYQGYNFLIGATVRRTDH